jgi:tetratricopeptide (TPR) repeat protein
MEWLTVGEYEAEACRALEAGAPARALAIEAHILAHHPQALSAHLLVGEALHRCGHANGAQEFFLRSLSADPEATRAYAGLSQLAAADGDLAQAIWYAERALESAPAGERGRQWLRRLCSRRDGAERRGISLTRAALARIYASSGCLHRARLELETLLREMPQRLDLQTTLIEVLWRLEGDLGLARQCEQILGRLPRCWKVNLIWGLRLQREGHPAGAAEHFAQARAVDPGGERSTRLLGAEAELPWRPVSVPPWDGANLARWTGLVAQLQKSDTAFSPEDVAWMWGAKQELDPYAQEDRLL